MDEATEARVSAPPDGAEPGSSSFEGPLAPGIGLTILEQPQLPLGEVVIEQPYPPPPANVVAAPAEVVVEQPYPPQGPAIAEAPEDVAPSSKVDGRTNATNRRPVRRAPGPSCRLRVTAVDLKLTPCCPPQAAVSVKLGSRSHMTSMLPANEKSSFSWQGDGQSEDLVSWHLEVPEAVLKGEILHIHVLAGRTDCIPGDESSSPDNSAASCGYFQIPLALLEPNTGVKSLPGGRFTKFGAIPAKGSPQGAKPAESTMRPATGKPSGRTSSASASAARSQVLPGGRRPSSRGGRGGMSQTSAQRSSSSSGSGIPSRQVRAHQDALAGSTLTVGIALEAVGSVRSQAVASSKTTRSVCALAEDVLSMVDSMNTSLQETSIAPATPCSGVPTTPFETPAATALTGARPRVKAKLDMAPPSRGAALKLPPRRPVTVEEKAADVRRSLSSHFASLLEALQAFDTDGDGLIMFEEFRTTVVASGYLRSAPESFMIVSSMWKTADVDELGFLSVGRLGLFLGFC